MDPRIRLEEMSTSEKLALMDLLWDDLAKAPDDIPSPAWHLQLLQAREEAIKTGTEEFLDWEIEKKKILDSLP